MCQIPPAIQDDANPDVTADDVFHVVDTNNPAFTTKRRSRQITENGRSRVEGGIVMTRTSPPPGAQVS
jgi:hypothetical protein